MVSKTPVLQQTHTIDSGNGYSITAIGRWKVAMPYWHDVPVTDYLGRFQMVKTDDRDRRAVLETKYDKVHDYRYTELFEVVDERNWDLSPTKIPEGERGEWEQEYREEKTPDMPSDAYARQLYAKKGFRERPKRMANDGSGFVVDTPLGPVNEEALRALIANNGTGQVFGNSEEEFAPKPAGDPNNVANPGSTELQESGSPAQVVAQPLDLVDMLAADPEMRDRALQALIASGTFADKNGNPLKGMILQKKLAAKEPVESTPPAE